MPKQLMFTLFKPQYALTLLIAIISSINFSWAQISFNTQTLQGTSLLNPTSLQFGPDGKLYIAEQNGTIKIVTVQKNQGVYSASSTETILLVKQIPNHNDDGTPKSYNISTNKRQITGICVAGTAANPIVYVTSSDNDIGAGSNGDKNLCTNSGIISKLIKSGGVWSKVDIVRGLPRSEENHANNGMVHHAATNKLYVAIGGLTNAGSPSKLFAYISEYAMSGAILSVDLNVIESLPTKNDPTGNHPYKYDMPTLDDPTRANNPDGSDINDPWGGNDGLNQSKLVIGGPVQIFATGFRNAYDLVLTKTPGKAGSFFTVDNGANQNWGGHPDQEGTPNVTNNYVVGEPGSNSAGPNDPKVNNYDALHYIGSISNYVEGSYYGGHPCPTRANPAGAGLYTHSGTLESGTGVWRTSKTDPLYPLPADWPPIPVSMANPEEGDFQNPGETNKAILTFTSSTNGICEYTSSAFNGQLKGDLFVVSYDGGMYRIKTNATGTGTLNSVGTKKINKDPVFATGFGNKPLDVTALGDNEIFPGTIWVALYGSSAIAVFEPQTIVCSGQDGPSDDDGDHYTNADEIDNGTNPCSASSKPADADNDFNSDLNDPDDDNDGIADLQDFFQIDSLNGSLTNIPLSYSLFNNDPGTGFFGLGFTGLMSNGTTIYKSLYNEDNLIAGGAIGAFTIANVPATDAFQGNNTQEYGFQFGLNVNSSTKPFFVHATMLGSFFNNQTPTDNQSQGIFIGKGDQSNYIKLVLNANGGQGGIQVLTENANATVSKQYNISGIPTTTTDLYIYVNPSSGKIWFKYALDGKAIVAIPDTITATGALLTVLQDNTNALAVGIISTSRSSGKPFNATWDLIEIDFDKSISPGTWTTLTTSNGSVGPHRQENAYVQAGNKFYLIGGRGSQSIYIYDPAAKTWTAGSKPPIVMHHFQAIEYHGLIYVAGAFTGDYPNETAIPNIYIYDPTTNIWTLGPEIPSARRRGSAGTIVYNNKIYLIGGIVNGHNDGFVSWFDEYDPSTNKWKVLPDAPNKRDHFHAAVINGKLYAAAGRNTSLATGNLVNLTIPKTDVYNFATNTWSTLPDNIPTERGGAATAVIGNELLVIGGESKVQFNAHNEAEAQNVETGKWRKLDTLNKGRHGTQAISNNGSVFISSGNGTRGGGAELNSHEEFHFNDAKDLILPLISKSNLTGPASYNFGKVQADATKTDSIIIANSAGNQAIIIKGLNLLTNPGNSFAYALPYSLPLIIAPGKTLKIGIQYTALQDGVVNALLEVAHSGNGGKTSITLSGEKTTSGGNNPPSTALKTGVYFINAGGNPIPTDSIMWAGDSQTTPSEYSNYTTTYNKTTVSTLKATNTTDAPTSLFSSYRWDTGTPGDPLYKEMSWKFPVDSGLYEINLYFAENWSGGNSAGQRVFDVILENETVLNDYDIFVDAGFNKAVKKTFNVKITDGYIDIIFAHVVQNPRINGFAIYKVNPSYSKMEIATGSVTFDSTFVNSQSSKPITLSNSGNKPLLISSVSITGTNASEFAVQNTLPATIQPGQNYVLNTIFKPSTKGNKNATVTLIHDGQNTPGTIQLSGYAKPIVPTNPVKKQVIFRVNAGGWNINVNDTTGVNWAKDNYSNPSPYVNYVESNNKTFSTADSISLHSSVPAGVPKSMFQSERSNGNWSIDTLKWAFPVEQGGEVEVRLFFSEIFFNSSGQRAFNIEVEDTVRLQNYDIHQEVGHDVGVMKTFKTTSDGSLNINLIRVKQQPKINAIEIICLNDRCNRSNLKFAGIESPAPSSAYPNPFNNQVQVKMGEKKDGTMKIQIFNSKGELVEENNMKMLQSGEYMDFDFSHLPVDIYYLRLEDGNGKSETLKLIKQ